MRGDDVVGIIDWETAAWFPCYWEYVCAWNVNPQNRFWQQEVDKFLTPRPYIRASGAWTVFDARVACSVLRAPYYTQCKFGLPRSKKRGRGVAPVLLQHQRIIINTTPSSMPRS
ncbi:hypothetical protein TOPH_02253 [Tolypocladium ophioglossoides CBS 100239]|uniref:Aminoglycoside phosphotransferase domain-containing protein n=1 Tax=Tolypocladium ophioglossoides (strain CBS 100239) TaxID=1163406 RepID=A0A0L0NG91_TOLOC|nr:hypothetical protein TOPH_02253 [Tolypocladium ophioglossoides CBS 100239]